jgi:bifunctional non-homologous end joining protein LigD
VLVRTRIGAGGRHEWLLIHKRDDHAVDGWQTEEHPRSVLTGRTNDDVRAGRRGRRLSDGPDTRPDAPSS